MHPVRPTENKAPSCEERHLLVDSAVEVVDVEDVNGQPHDSSVFLVAWDGHGPDTVISVSVGPGFNGWQATWNGGSAGVTSSPPQTALDWAMAPPGRDCSSLLTEAPADLDPPVPVRCQEERINMSFTLTAPISDTLRMPRQTLQGLRAEF